MQAQLFTISSLAVQLKLDRRTMTKKLEGLPPAQEVKRKDGSVIRSWYLADVVKHLQDPRASRLEAERREGADRMQVELKRSISEELFPMMFESAIQAMTGAFVGDAGLSKAKALRCCELAFVTLHHGLCEALGEDVETEIPESLRQAREMGHRAFIRKHWAG